VQHATRLLRVAQPELEARPAAALARRDSVLEAMLRYGDITADQYRQAVAQHDLRLNPWLNQTCSLNPVRR